MKTNNKKIKPIFLSLCIIIATILGIFALLRYSGIIITDRSAWVGTESVMWNGKTYVPISGVYDEKKTVAKSEDGAWSINEIEEDPSHTFIVARSFLDQYLYVDEKYEIPRNGALTKVCWGNRRNIKNDEILSALSRIDDLKKTDFECSYEEIIRNGNMQGLYFAYENCPVATVSKGYLGKIDDKWVVTTKISIDGDNDDGSLNIGTVGCYYIPDEYSEILEEYFFGRFEEVTG